MKRMQLKYRLEKERERSDGHATGAIDIQAREKYLMVIQWKQLRYRLE